MSIIDELTKNNSSSQPPKISGLIDSLIAPKVQQKTTAPKSPVAIPYKNATTSNYTPPKTTFRDTIATAKPAGSSVTIDSIIGNTKVSGSTKLPEKKTVQQRYDEMNAIDPSSVRGIATNTIKGIPKATLDFAIAAAQGTARAVGTVGVTAGNAPTRFANEITGANMPMPFDGQIETDKNPISKAVFGGEPIKDLPTLAQSGRETVKKITGKDIGTGGGYSLAVGSIALDLYPGSAGRTKLLKQLAEEGTEAGVATILRGNIKNITDETLQRMVPDLVNAKTAKEVELALVKNAKIPVNDGGLERSLKKELSPKGEFFPDSIKAKNIPPEKVERMVNLIDDFRAKRELPESAYENHYKTLEELGISADQSTTKIANQVEDILGGKIKTNDNYIDESKLKVQDSDLITEANKFKNGEDFYQLSGSKVSQMLRDKGIRGQEQVTKYWEEVTGKVSEKSYAMSHRPSKLGATGDDISKGGAIPEDVYEHPEWYGNMKDKTYQESFKAIKAMRGKPDMEVTIYRAAPKNELNDGDWITLSKAYAKQSSLEEGTPVHAFKVKAKEIQFAGDDINEFGYYPEGGGKLKQTKDVDAFDLTPKQATTKIRKLFDEDEIKLIVDDRIGKHTEFAKEKFVDEIQGFYKGEFVGVLKRGGKVQSSTLYHESGHAFFNRFLSPKDRTSYLDYIKKNKATELEKYKNESYDNPDARAEEWLMDDFARAMREDDYRGFLGTIYKKIKDTITRLLGKQDVFEKLYNRIKTKDRSYVRPNPSRKISVLKTDGDASEIDRIIASGKARVVSRNGRDVYQYKKGGEWVNARDENAIVQRFTLKPKQELSPELQERKIMLEVRKEVLKDNPLNKLSKYESKARPGELPELNNTGKGKFNQKGDQLVDEALGYKALAEDANDVEDASRAYEKLSAEKKAIKREEGALKADMKKASLPTKKQASIPSALKTDVPQVEGSTGEVRSLETLASESLSKAKMGDNSNISSLPEIITQTQTNVKDKITLLDYVRTPEKVLNKIGFGQEAKMLRKGYEGYIKELPKNIDKITEWSKGVSKESNVRLFRYLDGEAVDLTTSELKTANEIKAWLAEWAKRLDLPEDRTIKNYITHIFDDQLIKKEFDEDLAKIIADKIPGQIYDPFLEKRLGAKGYKQDTWGALEAYAKRATRKVNMDPALDAIKTRTGSTLDMSPIEESQFRYIQRYVNNVNMRPSELDNLLDNSIKSVFGYKLGQRPSMAVFRGLRQMTFRAMLGLNPGSALRNLSQGVNTYATLGEKYTTIGYSKLLSSNARKEILDSGILGENFIQDKVLSTTKKNLQRLDTALFFFFETAERINRGAAYMGAKAKYFGDMKKAGKESLASEEAAIKYAKDVVRKTQFSFGTIDTPVALQNELAKTIGQFQTYTVKQTEFLAGLVKDKDFAGLLRYTLAGFAFVYTVGQAFGMEPKELIPSIRFGTPPSLKFPVEVGKAVFDAPDKFGKDRDLAKKASDIGKTLFGIIPGGSQLKKTYEGLKASYEEGVYDKGDKLQYKVGDTTVDKLQLALFGKYATHEAKEYFKRAEALQEQYSIIIPIYEDAQKLKAEGKKEEANELYNSLPPDEKKIYKQYKENKQREATIKGKRDILPVYEKLQLMKEEGKKEEANAEYAKLDADQKKYYQMLKKDATKIKKASEGEKPDYDDGDVEPERGLIMTTLVYAKAIGVDPATAFNRIFTGQTIRRVDNGAIVVERLSMDESQKIKNDEGKATKEWKLDHTISLQLGGSNDIENLKLVPTEVHSAYTPIENALGKALREKKISKKEAQDLIKSFKLGEISADYIYTQLQQ